MRLFPALLVRFFHLSTQLIIVLGNPNANRLFEDLLSNYNKLVRPVSNNSDPVEIQFKLKLLQILDVHEKNQVLSINGWLVHIWHDYKLMWDPKNYGGINVMHIPAELIWLPDIILYNNADGSPQVTTITKAHVYSTGQVMWEPPVIYNSMCQIDIKFFPFDEQFCYMKFGSWTFYGSELSMIHLKVDNVSEAFEKEEKVWVVERGIDISEYQESVEWDLMSVVGKRHDKRYPCCEYPFIDIVYYINIRRKTLFYTINLITPCVGITFLTSLVFYLPSDSNNKITLCVSVLVSLTVFFLLLIEIIPPTSLDVPLIGRYLLFTMILVSMSVWATVMTINIHYRSALAVPIPKWVRWVFINFLPRILCISNKRTIERGASRLKQQLPKFLAPISVTAHMGAPSVVSNRNAVQHTKDSKKMQPGGGRFKKMGTADAWGDRIEVVNGSEPTSSSTAIEPSTAAAVGQLHQSSVELAKLRACANVCYIAEKLREREEEDNLKEDWKFIAMVIDRVLLSVFTTSIVIGTIVIIFSAPILQDVRIPITTIVKEELELMQAALGK